MLDDIREWISDNLRYIALGVGALLILIIIVSVVRLVGGSGNGTSSQSSSSVSDTQQTVQNTAEAVEETTELQDSSASGALTAVSSGDLIRDDAAVLTLVEQYYTAVAEKDTRTLSSIVTPWDETVQANVLRYDDVEAYRDIRVYSKTGRKDGEYVVFAASEIKLTDIETAVPNLDMMYLVTGTGGALQVASNMNTDAEISAFVTQASSSADVQTLVTEINNSYAQALAKDEQLSQYMSSSAAEPSSQTAETTDTADSEEVSDDSAEAGESTASSNVSVGASMAATTTINIRQTASTSAAIMGVLPEGTSITVLSDAGNGWVEISYSTSVGDIVGYVMADYLTSAGSAALSDDAAAADNSAV